MGLMKVMKTSAAVYTRGGAAGGKDEVLIITGELRRK
jgi:hypothetical protein